MDVVGGQHHLEAAEEAVHHAEKFFKEGSSLKHQQLASSMFPFSIYFATIQRQLEAAAEAVMHAECLLHMQLTCHRICLDDVDNALSSGKCRYTHKKRAACCLQVHTVSNLPPMPDWGCLGGCSLLLVPY